MQLMIQHNSMVPIYEQLYNQIQQQIMKGQLTAETALPSVRKLAKELHISALTVKKAYDQLDASGLIHTVPGKGSFVAAVDPEMEKEAQRQAIQQELTQTITKAKQYQLTQADITTLVALLWEVD